MDEETKHALETDLCDRILNAKETNRRDRETPKYMHLKYNPPLESEKEVYLVKDSRCSYQNPINPQCPGHELEIQKVRNK